VVLPDTTLASVRELISRARHRHRVLHDWGFERKLAKGLGLSALFSGPPGTGKTMIAGIIARELALELYQIDLSRVVSKYVGETEKNLSEVFEAADWGNVLLLFDEADALFSKRTDVKSSNDRFSNMEINYLLQRLERFEGVSILTTNLEGSIDQAFKRRLSFRVSFPMPDASEREVLWRRMVPKEAHLAEPLDFAELAQRYEFTGGNIRNGMLRAAFLAAGEDRGITMEHVHRAVTLEYHDAGLLAIGGKLNQ
jgi:SpoVK/Ycf46/Vps4 family AAA+-type ATPase